MKLSHQKDPDLARIKREVEKGSDAIDLRQRDSEAFESYVRGELVPYLVGLAGFVAFPPPPEPPP